MNPRNDFYISYSARKLYLTCPKAYHYRYILKDKTRGDPKNTMFGTIIGRIFEDFYTKSYWREKNPLAPMLASIPAVIDDTFSKESYVRGSDWSYENKLKEDLAHFVPLGLNVIKENRFLTPNSQAEVDLTVRYQSDSMDYTIKMAGRADFIHGESLTSIYILDGKASFHREKYVDSEQLIWYATQYYLKHSEAPKRLGFIFWAFPDNPVTWVAYTSDDMRACVQKTVHVSNQIRAGNFDARPSTECERCNFKAKCEEGTRHLAQLKIHRNGRIDTDLFDMEAV